jgi:N-acetylglutamate synthase-like GNAT family acetyltransferase
MEIRLAKRSEADAVRECVDTAFSHWIEIIGRKPVAMLTDFTPLIEQEKVYVAHINDSLVGVLAMWLDHDALYVDTVAVNPTAQNQGVGQRLLKFAEAEAVKREQSKMSLCTNEKMQSNRDYYARLGYKEVRFDKLADGRGVVWMEKALALEEPEDDTLTKDV